MANDEGPFDTIVNAFRFGVSNVTSLAIWGIAFVAAAVIMFVIIFFAMLAFYDNENVLMMIVAFLLSYLPIIAVGIPFLGFISQCLKTVINGGNVMPTGLESIGDLIKDGIMIFIITIEAFIMVLISFAPGFLLIFLGRSSDFLIMAGFVLMLLAIPIMLVIYFLNVIQWAVYADTGSLLQGLNPLRPVGIVLSNPGGAAIAVLSIIVAYVAFTVILFICELLIITILLLPFLMVAMYGCLMYLVARFYIQSRGDRFDNRDVVTAGYSVS